MAYTRINWQDGPQGGTPLSAANLNVMDAGIEAAHQVLDAATPNATANTLMRRDSSGRARVAAPTENTHIANKGYVDNLGTSALTPNTVMRRDADGRVAGAAGGQPGRAVNVLQLWEQRAKRVCASGGCSAGRYGDGSHFPRGCWVAFTQSGARRFLLWQVESLIFSTGIEPVIVSMTQDFGSLQVIWSGQGGVYRATSSDDQPLVNYQGPTALRLIAVGFRG